MGVEDSDSDVDDDSESTQSGHPFGLSYGPLAVLVVLVGIIVPGVLVYTLEQANLSGVANFVWVLSYATTIFVAWFIWLRPLNLVGPIGADSPTQADEGQADSESESRTDAADPSNSVE
ncbi:MAG: hypothetical protein ACI8TL_001922 [Natronomonas sp.]|jgi:hypothetical protein